MCLTDSIVGSWLASNLDVVLRTLPIKLAVAEGLEEFFNMLGIDPSVETMFP
jgi:hypothetical protein